MAKLSGKLSVLMPAYNEETIIYANALEAARQISPLADDYELLVIDDGSSDRTKAEIERAAAENPKIRCISYQPNQGKGGALREGTAHATGDYVAFCDADLDLAPEQLADFIDRMQRENADVVIGSKMHPESKVDYPAIRRVYSWGYYILLLILFRLNVRDTQTGLKLFKAEVIKPVMRQILVKRLRLILRFWLSSMRADIKSLPHRLKLCSTGSRLAASVSATSATCLLIRWQFFIVCTFCITMIKQIRWKGLNLWHSQVFIFSSARRPN